MLHATTGIKLTIFYDAFDRARFFNGFLTSVRLMTLCIVCSVAIGVVGAWVQGSRLRLLRAVTAGLHPVLSQHAAAGAALLLLFRARRHTCASPTRPGSRCRSSRISPGRRSACRSTPAPSTSRFFAPASRRCRRKPSRPPRRSATAGCKAYAPCDPAARLPHQPAGAQQQSRQSREDDDDRLRHRGARRCSTSPTRSGRTS